MCSPRQSKTQLLRRHNVDLFLKSTSIFSYKLLKAIGLYRYPLFPISDTSTIHGALSAYVCWKCIRASGRLCSDKEGCCLGVVEDTWQWKSTFTILDTSCLPPGSKLLSFAQFNNNSDKLERWVPKVQKQ